MDLLGVLLSVSESLDVDVDLAVCVCVLCAASINVCLQSFSAAVFGATPQRA